MIYFFVYFFTSLISIIFFWKKIPGDTRTALLWFYLFYFFSNMLGAIIFGFANIISFNEIIDLIIETYIQGEYVQPHLQNLYWFLLFSPFIFLPLFCLEFRFKKINLNKFHFNLTQQGFLLSTVIILGFFFAEIYSTDNLGILTLSNLTNSKENYADYIIGRADVFNTMSNRFFGFLYMTLPFFSHISIYNACKKNNSKFWLIISSILIIIITVVSIGVNQKAPLVIYFISLFIGLSSIIKFNKFLFIGAPLVILLIINFLQVFIQGSDGWTLTLSFFHTIFRAPSSIPFYVNYYPEKFPFVGIDFGILANFYIPTSDALDNYDIHTVMWGQGFEADGVNGTVAAPFHFRAFAQAGLFFSIFNIFILSFFIKLIGSIKRSNFFSDSSISHAFFSQSLIVLYFLSQTHIKDCLWSSYGIIWIFKGVFLLFFSQIIILVLKSLKQNISIRFK